MKRKLRSQPRISGTTRTPTHSSILPEVWDLVDSLASKYGVSRSWVIATIVSEAVNAKARQLPYYKVNEAKAKLRRVK